MKKTKVGLIVVCAMFCFSCGSKHERNSGDAGALDSISLQSADETLTSSAQKKEIQDLIRKVLHWKESDTTFCMHPFQAENDGVLVGFDAALIQKNMVILRSTGLFSKVFVDNYKKLMFALDDKIRRGAYGECFANEMPPYKFATDVDPWTLSQDVPYDEPNPLDYVEIFVIKLNDKNGELNWKWGRLPSSVSSDWKEFSYKFKVVKEDGKWMISYLQGFDYEDNI